MRFTPWVLTLLIFSGSMTLLVPDAQADGRRGQVRASIAVGDVFFSVGTPAYVHYPRHYHPGYRSKIIYHYTKPHKHYKKYYYKPHKHSKKHHYRHGHRPYYKPHKHAWKGYRHSYKDNRGHYKYKPKQRHGPRHRR